MARTTLFLKRGSSFETNLPLTSGKLNVNFSFLELNVTRSIWHQVVGDCKTEASARPVPMDEYMAEDLQRWRRHSPYPMADDLVFASPSMRGKQPYWPDNLMNRYVKPVAKKAGNQKKHRMAHFPSFLRHAAEG